MIEDVVATDRIATLRNIPLFDCLDDAGLERVAAVATEVGFREGAVLIECDTPGSGLFLILEGTVRVELPNRDVDAGPGEFVGELSLLTERVERSARVLAASDVRCLAIGRSDLAALLQAEPRIALPMLELLARRLLEATSGAPTPAG